MTSAQNVIQFRNTARRYSDIFKFQVAYSSNMVQLGLSVVPTQVLSRRIDSNVVNFERAGSGTAFRQSFYNLTDLTGGAVPG
jgi:hypothetical protein